MIKHPLKLRDVATFQAEANRKRAEAALGNDNAVKGKTVEPQSEARLNNKPPARSQPEGKTSTAKAKTIGVSRAAVERAETIKRNSPELAQKVAQGEISAADALRTIKKVARPPKPRSEDALPMTFVDYAELVWARPAARTDPTGRSRWDRVE